MAVFTKDIRERQRSLRAWGVGIIGGIVVGIALYAGISVYVMYQTNRREWVLLRLVEQAGGRATFTDYGPVQMPQRVPNGHLFSQLRIGYVDLVAVPRQAEWLAELRSLTHLRHLSLGEAPLTDDDVKPLGALTNLETLSITRAPITDDSLGHLRHMTRLKRLQLTLTETTPSGRDRLRKLLPDCEIQPDP